MNGAKLLEEQFNATAVPIPCDSPYEYWDKQNTYGKTERGFDTVDCNKCRVVCPKKYVL